jgi:Muconolactone delta-isomerase
VSGKENPGGRTDQRNDWLAMIVEAASPLELDRIVESLPVWPLMETSVTPLTTFEDGIHAISPRLERAKADAHK